MNLYAPGNPNNYYIDVLIIPLLTIQEVLSQIYSREGRYTEHTSEYMACHCKHRRYMKLWNLYQTINRFVRINIR